MPEQQRWFGLPLYAWFNLPIIAMPSLALIVCGVADLPGRMTLGIVCVCFFLSLPLRRACRAVVLAAADQAIRAAAPYRPLKYCIKCGYDLRATPERCPECGIAPSKLGRGG